MAFDSSGPRRRYGLAVIERYAESTAACLLTMLQGDPLASTFNHWLVASETGAAAGVLSTAALAATRAEQRGPVALSLAAVTAAVDLAVHPGGFGPFFLEAVVTGAAAGGLSLAVARAKRRCPQPVERRG